MKMPTFLLVAGVGLGTGGGCVSLALHITPAQSNMPPDFPNGAVIYPTLHAFGDLFGTKGEGPLDYLFVAADFPFSLVLDTLFVPYDLTHPISSLRRVKPATRPTPSDPDGGGHAS